MSNKQDYLYPVKRIGNENNPKLVILLSNPGGSSEFYKRLPEYIIDKDALYSDSGMDLHKYREYCKWWDDVLNATDCYINDTDILALEYYPYHTVGSSDIAKSADWDDYAKKSLVENTDILKKSLSKNVLVFGYYWGSWLSQVPSLETHPNFYKSKNTQGQTNKIKELETFLHKYKGSK